MFETVINVCECVIGNCLLVPFFPHIFTVQPRDKTDSPRQQDFLCTHQREAAAEEVVVNQEYFMRLTELQVLFCEEKKKIFLISMSNILFFIS